MAKFRTLEMVLTGLKVTRIAAGIYRNEVTVTDWDDGEEISFIATTVHPVIAISTFNVRVQIEDLIESPPSE